MKTFILTLLLCFASVAAFSQSSGQKQLLIVEVVEPYNINAFVKGIFINEAGKETRFIPFEYKGLDEKGNRSKFDLVAQTFRELYAQGWVLSSATGGDMHKRYLFEK